MKRIRHSPTISLVLLVAVGTLTFSVLAQQQPAGVNAQRAFLNQYCASCHNQQRNIANVNFDAADKDIAHVTDNRELWEKVVRRLRVATDPPSTPGVPSPPAAARNAMIQFLENELDRNAKPYVPPIGSHRLNRTEYTNAIRDLLDLEFDSSKLLPPDDSTSGFDDIVGALESQRSREAYVGIAPIVSRLSIQTGTNDPSYQRIFQCRPARYTDAACAKQIITTLAGNAFRGSATPADIDGLMATYTAGLPGGGFDRGIEAALAQILASPKFIYRSESNPDGGIGNGTYRISDLALASRLSFFLWSSSPDEELIALAKPVTLHTAAVLEKQTLRMLQDYRAEALSLNFAGQWLNLRNMSTVAPSPILFSDFDEPLRQAMRREVEMLFDSIVREDRNVVDLLTADYTFVNNRLARHYGIPNITGSQFRRVTLTDAFDVRRGLLGKSAFLTVTSHDDRTSPVTRSKWILSQLLGVPPPDPPADVPALRGLSATIPNMRTMMEMHNTGACVECHRIMDPIGFSLENFNPIGAWRDAENGTPINAVNTLYDGTKINSPADLRRWLVGRSDPFIQVMTQKLMTYALGRRVEAQDMPLIRAIDREAARNNNRFSAFVLGIVKSDTFQMNSK